MSIDIPLYFIVKPILWVTKFFADEKAVLACKGYGDDWEFYTGLHWDEDKNNDLCYYEDFRLWIGF